MTLLPLLKLLWVKKHQFLTSVNDCESSAYRETLVLDNTGVTPGHLGINIMLFASLSELMYDERLLCAK